MAGPGSPAEALADARDRDVARESGRVHDFDGRGPDEIDAFALQQGAIALELARIGVEILSRAELQRIHEDRDHDMRGAGPGLAHQCQMAFMKRAHGGDQRDRSVPAQVVDCTA